FRNSHVYDRSPRDSCTSWLDAPLSRLAAGGGAADAAEQPGPGGRGAAPGAGRVRRDGQGRARLAGRPGDGRSTRDPRRRAERSGLTMYGQMTAGSWIYIGTQGILQGTYETFGAVAREHFGGSLRGRWVLTGGMGGMGGAQPLAATMNEGAMLCVEVDPARIE